MKGRTKSWDVRRYEIWDLEQPHADSPRPDVICDIERDVPPRQPIADIVFCLEVFDYLIEPAYALRHLSYTLKKFGFAYVSFPFVYPTHNPIEHEGLRYTENSIRRLADLAGLEVVELIPRRPETNLLDQFYRAERMRAAKGYDHAVTGWIGTFRRAG